MKYYAAIIRPEAGSVMASPRMSSCATCIVTKGASADGCVMIGHSGDNYLGEQSIVRPPIRNRPEGSMRPAYPSGVARAALSPWNTFLTPRPVAPERAPGDAHPGDGTPWRRGKFPKFPMPMPILAANTAS